MAKYTKMTVVGMVDDVDRFHYQKYGLNVTSDFLFDILRSNRPEPIKIFAIARAYSRLGLITHKRIAYNIWMRSISRFVPLSFRL